ncbi:MAG: ABC transporter permease [Opitutaceae bacterium]
MRAYFLRRLLLIPPTLVGITLIVFFITRIVPGGPLEQALMRAQMSLGGAASARAGAQGTALSSDQIEQLKHYYGFDRPWPVAYVQWLGKVATGNLGTSYRYNEPVWDLIAERFPISLFYGGITLVVTFGVCIPLGILKAIRHNTWVDTVSSILIFVGYAVPGYILAALLLVFFAAKLGWFPLGGFVSDGFSGLSFLGKVGDLVHHAVLPLICYLVGSFAFVTLLMKNHLLDNLAADYMRTAVAKGVPGRKAVLTHALRNSLIPLATAFGQSVTLLVSGSFLIETIFDIDGVGLLGYTSVLDRDYPVILGELLITALVILLGNILSDVLVALTDPRVKFS